MMNLSVVSFNFLSPNEIDLFWLLKAWFRTVWVIDKIYDVVNWNRRVQWLNCALILFSSLHKAQRITSNSETNVWSDIYKLCSNQLENNPFNLLMGIYKRVYIRDVTHIVIAHFVWLVVTMCTIRNKVLISVLAFVALSLSGVSTSFHYDSDLIATSLRDDGSITEDYLQDPKLRVAKRYYREFSMNTSENIFLRRVKREDESTFIGNPKTREERWHASFNLNRTNLELEQAQSLVNLLVKVMDKYLNSCIPIIFYDFQASEGIVLQTFFKVWNFWFLWHWKSLELLETFRSRCRR